MEKYVVEITDDALADMEALYEYIANVLDQIKQDTGKCFALRMDDAIFVEYWGENRSNPEAVEVLMAIGMYCIGCFASSMESLEDACMVHELDAEQIVEAVNVVIEERRKPAEVA